MIGIHLWKYFWTYVYSNTPWKDYMHGEYLKKKGLSNKVSVQLNKNTNSFVESDYTFLVDANPPESIDILESRDTQISANQ